MPREPRVCYYPVFTRSEALELQQKALAISATVEEYIRTRCDMYKYLPDVPTAPPRPVGRPPLPPEERVKRETWRAALTKLRRFLAVDAVGTADVQSRDRHYAAKEMVRRHETGIEDFTWEGFHRVVELARYQPQRLHEAPPTRDWPRSGFPPPFEEYSPDWNPLRDHARAYQADQTKKVERRASRKRKK